MTGIQCSVVLPASQTEVWVLQNLMPPAKVLQSSHYQPESPINMVLLSFQIFTTKTSQL
jgi:hypothetical protein